ncbi:hypothetical protein IGI39_003623 [Enterococcus sp. AZ135]
MLPKDFEYLDDKQWSDLWEDYMDQAVHFNPLEVHEISCIIPLPERDGLLIFSDTNVYFCENSLLTMLYHYSSANNFPDYQILTRVFKTADLYGKYKYPWVCQYFTLFPLEAPHRSIWINPLKIADVHTIDGQCYVSMLDGPTLILPVHDRRLFIRAESACIALATIRRGHFHFNRNGDRPIDYLDFPDTYFAKKLKQSPLLQNFDTLIGELGKIYHQSYSVHHFENLIDDPDDLYQINWR